MHASFPRRVAPYAAALLLCILILTWVMQLWRADLRAPFNYHGDVLFCGMMIKGVVENGWYLTHPRLGAPGQGELHDFPMADSLHFVVLRFLALLCNDHVVAINLFFLLTFPLTTLAAYAVLRRLHFGHVACLMISLLFTFLPYHFYRNISHLFLAGYYLVPFAVLVSLWVYREPVTLFPSSHGTGGGERSYCNRRTVVAVVVCLLMSSAGIYYAFFTCFFFVIAGLAQWVVQPRARPVLVGGALASLVVVGGIVNLSPSLLYWARHGRNPLTAHSNYVSAEIYGLKVAQLLLPTPEHRVRRLARIRQNYDVQQPPGEGGGASLGILGSLGFLLLLARLFYRKPLTATPELESGLWVLNGAGVLLATVGGFGSLFALMLMPSIRGYNRISVYLAFFSLMALVLFVERIFRPHDGSPRRRLAYHGVLLAMLVLGILDQTSPRCIPHYEELASVYHNDLEFVRAVEDALPAGSAVFQLPYIPFPEVVPPGRMLDYDPMRGYLYSRSLRWSYGAVKGRETDRWQGETASRPVEDMVPILAQAGFAGIYVDREGYEDRGARVEATLRRLLDAEPVRSRDDRFFLFSLTAYGKSDCPKSPIE
jgi:phosphoglycerol transferase